jgi:plastocyanin
MRTLPQHTRKARSRAVLPAVAGAIAALTLTACGGATPASGDVHPGSADEHATAIVALDNEFEPAVLELDPGSEVTLEVTNEGEQPHNLVIDEVDLSTGTIEPGDVVTATFTVPDATVTYYCSFHPGMDGEIQPKTG